MASFNALMLREDGGTVRSDVTSIDESQLPAGEVLVRVDYSTLNYKDGMVLKGLGRLVRSYPHVPGIDFAGTVEQSDDPDLRPGDPVVLTGWRVGEVSWGGYAQKARVKRGQLVKLPPQISTRRAMAIGTAGLTAMLAVIALERHGVTPEAGEILVTGAAGGVGSVAVAVLAKLGHVVHASTGRPEQEAYLRQLGAAAIVARDELAEGPKRPLDSERWAGAVDAVGGKTLATILSQIKYRGAVAACGLAGGSDLPTTVIPFLLRGANLLGIDSVMCPMAERAEAWARLAHDLPGDLLDSMTKTVPLQSVPELADEILGGRVRGRLIIDVNA